MVALQCSVSCYWTAKWISHTYTYPSLLEFLPIQVTTVHKVKFPMLYSLFSSVIYFIHSISSVYVGGSGLRGHMYTCGQFMLIYGEGNGTPLQYSRLENPMDRGAWWAAVHEVAKSRTRLSDFTLTFHFCALEKEMATHSSILAWRIPGTGKPGGLPSMGSHRVGHDWSNLAAAAAACWYMAKNIMIL